MALPENPSVVVIENDVSIYTPNVNSSVVGIVGFADKGPIDEATLVTSQENLIALFGKPNSAIPGQGLEGALEILEATNQIYYVRAASSTATAASASVPLGFCPAVQVSASYLSSTATSNKTLAVTAIDPAGTQTTSIITLTSGTGVTTGQQLLLNALNPAILNDQLVFAYVDSNGNTFLASRYAGSGCTLTVSSNDTNLLMYAVSANGDARDDLAASVDITASGGTFTALHAGFYSNYKGTGYNLSGLRDGTTQGLSIEVDNISIRDKITVNSDGSQREVFNISLSPSSPASLEFLLNTDIDNNNSDYVNALILSSTVDYVGIPNNFADKTSVSASYVYGGATVSDKSARFVKPVEGTFSFANGNSGYATDAEDGDSDAASLIGTATAKTGLYALDDDSLNISIGIVPGITNQSVQNALITLAETSKNFVAVVAPPYALGSVQAAVDWMNGKSGSTGRSAAINNSYAAVYWPWVQVFNPIAGADEWYDPSIFAVRQMVFTDSVAEPWFAPAGPRRGRLTKPVDVEFALNEGDKGVLYANNINYIEKESGYGIMIGGQKTAQRLPTALDRVNVRRLLVYVRKTLLRLGKPFQFEPNDSLLWEEIEDALNPFISDLTARRAIVAGAVKCDATTNTPLRVDRNEVWTSVSIKPVKAAEWVVFEVNVTNQSATING